MLASHCENIGGPPNGNGSGGAAFTVPTLIVIGLTAYYGTQVFFRNVRQTLLDAGVDVSTDVYAQPQSRPTATIECCPVIPTPTRTPRTIVELGSGDFSNLIKIAQDYPDDRVMGIEKDPSQIALAKLTGNYAAAIAAGAEIHSYNFGNGLHTAADEIIAIAPNPFNLDDFVGATQSINPGGRIYMAVGVIERTYAEYLRSELSKLHGVPVIVSRGRSRYPSDYFGRDRYDALIIDFVVP
jgi:hypothetical protein